jgi:hypothetical protein
LFNILLSFRSDLGAQIDGFAALVGTTVVVGGAVVDGEKADVIKAAEVCAFSSCVTSCGRYRSLCVAEIYIYICTYIPLLSLCCALSLSSRPYRPFLSCPGVCTVVFCAFNLLFIGGCRGRAQDAEARYQH